MEVINELKHRWRSSMKKLYKTNVLKTKVAAIILAITILSNNNVYPLAQPILETVAKPVVQVLNETIPTQVIQATEKTVENSALRNISKKAFLTAFGITRYCTKKTIGAVGAILPSSPYLRYPIIVAGSIYLADRAHKNITYKIWKYCKRETPNQLMKKTTKLNAEKIELGLKADQLAAEQTEIRKQNFEKKLNLFSRFKKAIGLTTNPLETRINTIQDKLDEIELKQRRINSKIKKSDRLINEYGEINTLSKRIISGSATALGAVLAFKGLRMINYARLIPATFNAAKGLRSLF